MMNLLLRCVVNRTLFISVINVCKNEKCFHSNSRKARGILSNVFCTENTRTCRRLIHINNVKSFSTTTKNRVKYFTEHENEYAHVVMESNPAYLQKLYKRDSPEHKSMSDDDYNKCVGNDWSNSSPPELLSAFTDITNYCLTHSKPITEPELNNVCNAIAAKCMDFGDRELIACLECLTRWPETESLNSANFVDVWSALDKVCVSRTKVWDVGTLLYVADIWYSLHLSRVCKYVGECIWRLGRRLKSLSPQELVQCMFYMNSSRKFKIPSSMYEFEFYLEQCVQNLSIDELAIVSMGFFKSKTPIRSPRVLSCMIQKTTEVIDNVSEISLCSLMKLFRYCLPVSLGNDMCKLLDKTVPNINRVSHFCCVQIALVGTSTQLFHKQVISAIAQRFVQELPSSRLKDIERMVFVLTLYDYVPECEPDFFENVVAEIKNSARLSEIHQYPKNLAYCLNYLTHREIYSTELLDKVLSKQFIEETYDRKNLYSLGRELLCLDVGIEIECPNYRGNRLNPRARSFLAKRYTKWVPDRTKTKLSVTERMFVEVLEAAEVVIGKECVYADVISPNYTLPDIVVGVDADGKGVPVAGLFSSYRIEDVKYPPRGVDNHRWFCLVVGGMNMFIRNENVPLGTTKTRLRHLTKIGYHPVLVPWFEFTELTLSEKPDYLRERIFSSSCG